MPHAKFAGAVAVAVCLAGVLLVAQGKPSVQGLKPITIDIPGVENGAVSLQTAGAWPLTIRLMANNPLGIGTYAVPDQFPTGSQQAFLVFADPDGCFSLSLAHDPDIELSEKCPGGADETYLEFTPAVNMANLRQFSIGKVAASRLGAAPTLWWKWAKDGSDEKLEPVGPPVGCNIDDPTYSPAGCTAPDVYDNYGYGASPNVPGLVILSDRGVGLVWNSDFLLAQPKAARNLAGLVNSIAWTLNDCVGWQTTAGQPSNERALERSRFGWSAGCDDGRTSVTAHMNVPRNLFSPVVRIDLGFPADGGLTTGRAYQIDGGAIVDDNSHQLLTKLNQMVTTVRVFVVSGHGPDVLEDMDGNGVVDANDARLAGFKVLSDEKVFRLRTYHQSHTRGSDLGILYDLKGNDGMQGDAAPGGSGGVTNIPR